MKPENLSPEMRSIFEQARGVLWRTYPGQAPAGTVVLAGERDLVDTVLCGDLPPDNSPLAAVVMSSPMLSVHVMRWVSSASLSPAHVENAKTLCRYLRECYVESKPPRIILVADDGFHIVELQPDEGTNAPGGSA